MSVTSNFGTNPCFLRSLRINRNAARLSRLPSPTFNSAPGRDRWEPPSDLFGYEKRADELLEIADDSSADWIDTGNGNRVFDSVHVNRARLMIDTRKWLLSKMLPKIYGDHVTIAGDADQPIRHVVQRIEWSSLSDEEIEAIEAFALAAQRRLNAAREAEEQMTPENGSLIPQR